LAATAAGTVFSTPYSVKLFTGGINQSCLIGKYSGLGVVTVTALHAYAGSGQIGRANVGSLEIKYKHLKMDSRAQHPLQSSFYNRVSVKIESTSFRNGHNREDLVNFDQVLGISSFYGKKSPNFSLKLLILRDFCK